MPKLLSRQVGFLATALLLALSLLGCSPAQYPLEPLVDPDVPAEVLTAKEYCPALIDSLDDLEEAVLKMVDAGDQSLRPDAAVAARKVALVLLTAEHEGTETDGVENVWFIRAHQAARVFFTIVEAPEDEYSEDEIAEALENVFGWLDNARWECRGSLS